MTKPISPSSGTIRSTFLNLPVEEDYPRFRPMECELRQCMSQAVSHGLSLSAGLMQKSSVTLEVHVNRGRAKGQKGPGSSNLCWEESGQMTMDTHLDSLWKSYRNKLLCQITEIRGVICSS